MGKRVRIAVIMLLFLLVVVMLTSTNVLAAEKGREKKEKGKPLTYEPKVLSAINEGTTRVQVYVYSHTTLYIRNGSTLIAQRRYGRNGVKTVRIPRQKKGNRLSFQLRNNLTNLLGRVVYRTVGRGNARGQGKGQAAGWISTGSVIYDGRIRVSGAPGSGSTVRWFKMAERPNTGKWR